MTMPVFVSIQFGCYQQRNAEDWENFVILPLVREIRHNLIKLSGAFQLEVKSLHLGVSL